MDQVSFSAEQFGAVQAPSNAPTFFHQLWVFGILATLKVSGNETGGAFAMHEDLVAPGSRGPYPHYHTREDEYWYMAEGELTWIVDGKEISAPQGSSLHIRRGVLHGFENRSGQYARLLVMYTPGKFQEWFVEVGKPTEGASFPGPVPSPEDFGLAFHFMEVYGLGFTPPPKHEDGQHEEL